MSRQVGFPINESGIQFDDALGEELVNIIFDTVNNHSFSVQIEMNGEPDFSKFTDENINTRINEMNLLTPSVKQNASSLLGPEQLNLFEEA